MLQFDGKRSIALFDFKKDESLANNLVKDPAYKDNVVYMEEKIKAIIQQYNNRMVENNLTIR